MGGLLLDRDGDAARVEVDDAVTLGIDHVIGEDGGALAPFDRRPHQFGQAVPVEDVVPEDQARRLVADEIGPDHEGLGEPVG